MTCRHQLFSATPTDAIFSLLMMMVFESTDSNKKASKANNGPSPA